MAPTTVAIVAPLVALFLSQELFFFARSLAGPVSGTRARCIGLLVAAFSLLGNARPAHAYRCPPNYVPTLTLSFDGPIAGLAAPGSDVAFIVEDGDCKHRYAQSAARLGATVARSPQGPFTPTTLRDRGGRLVWRAPPVEGRYFLRVAAAHGTWPARVLVAAPAQVTVDVAPTGALQRVTLRLPTGAVPPRSGWLVLVREGVPGGWTPPRVSLRWSRGMSSRALGLPPGRWRAFDAVRFEHRSDDRPPVANGPFSPQGGWDSRGVVTITHAGATFELGASLSQPP